MEIWDSAGNLWVGHGCIWGRNINKTIKIKTCGTQFRELCLQHNSHNTIGSVCIYCLHVISIYIHKRDITKDLVSALYLT